MSRIASTESVRSIVTGALRANLGADGFGPWMTMSDVMHGRGMRPNQVRRRLYEMWTEGEVQARGSPDKRGRHESQQYRAVPEGEEAPLYRSKKGWDTQALADQLGVWVFDTRIGSEVHIPYTYKPASLDFRTAVQYTQEW